MDDTTRQLLGDDFTKQVMRDFGIEAESPEAQVYLMSSLGENIIQRITLEVLKIIPESEHEKFGSFIGGGDMNGLRKFLEPYIPDVDEFMQKTAKEEYEATKKLMDN